MYYQETVIAGKIIEIRKKYRYCRDLSHSRHAKMNISTEDQQKKNEKQAAKKLELLLDNNFCDGRDAHVTLTWRKEKRPKDTEGIRKALEKFLRELRKIYKKNNKVLKYVVVTEYQNKSVHHHLVINEVEMKEIMQAWQNGKVEVTPLYTNGQYSELADYLIKETSKTFRSPDAVYHKHWNGSKTLKQPKVIKKIIHAKHWHFHPTPIHGYYIEPGSLYNGMNAFGGGEYQCYRLIKLAT